METAPHSPPAPSHTSSGKNRLILIADDDDNIRNLLTTTLEMEGYRVIGSSDGEEAWTQLLRDSVDLLISDHDMPRLKGLDLLRRLRHNSLHIPVIMISGYMPWNELEEDSLEPIIPICKPFSLSLLKQRVRELLSPPFPDATSQVNGNPGLLLQHLTGNTLSAH